MFYRYKVRWDVYNKTSSARSISGCRFIIKNVPFSHLNMYPNLITLLFNLLLRIAIFNRWMNSCTSITVYTYFFFSSFCHSNRKLGLVDFVTWPERHVTLYNIHRWRSLCINFNRCNVFVTRSTRVRERGGWEIVRARQLITLWQIAEPGVLLVTSEAPAPPCRAVFLLADFLRGALCVDYARSIPRDGKAVWWDLRGQRKHANRGNGRLECVY